MKEKARHYNSKSWAAFNKKSQSATESEICALEILADVSWESAEDPVEALPMVKKCQLLFSELISQKSSESWSEYMTKILLPDIQREFDNYDMLASSLTLKPQSWLLASGPSFERNIKLLNMLDSLESDWVPVIPSAVQETLVDALKRTICCLLRMTIRDAKIKTETEELVLLWTALGGIRDGLNDTNFETALTSLLTKRHTIRPDFTREETFQAELAMYSSQNQDCIHLAFVILESLSIMDGLADPKVKLMSKTLLSSLRTYPARETKILANHSHFICYNVLLLLPSLTLDLEEINHCKFTLIVN
jgi:hypothetical protein